MKNRKRTQKPQGAFHKNLEQITYNRIMNMTILDSQGKIRFLHDNKDKKGRSDMYIVFDGRTNQTHYAVSYQAAEKRFNYLVANS